MYKVGVDLSPKQQSRLRNGHRVRIKKGMGVCLVVNPGNYDIMNRAFRRNKGVEIQLSPDEINENRMVSPEMQQEGYGDDMVGSGLFSKIGKTLKNAGSKTLTGLASAERGARGNPISRTIIKTALPLAAAEATKAALVYAGVDPKTAASMSKVSSAGTKAGLKSAGYGLYTGRGMGCGLEDLRRQTMGGYDASEYDSGVIKNMYRGKKGQMIIGKGAFISQSNHGVHQALQSQPYGENFSMQNQLPPQYAKLHNGTSTEGRGLYA